MEKSRRRFLCALGGTVIGGVPLANALAGGEYKAAGRGLAGDKWAMVIDVRKCIDRNDCKACQDACHQGHNVPKIEGVKDEIKWIWREPYKNAFPDQAHDYTEQKLLDGQLPVLCNHCEHPACVRVCPTQATFKRDDGIVLMDMHRCIGCRYCMAACPYGARSFNFKDPRPFIANIRKEFPTRSMGVVEKCNFCAERLAKGKGPLCVEACEKINCGALVFGDLGDKSSNVAQLLRKHNAIRRKPGLGTAPQVFYIV